jgi:hypothetical protein
MKKRKEKKRILLSSFVFVKKTVDHNPNSRLGEKKEKKRKKKQLDMET